MKMLRNSEREIVLRRQAAAIAELMEGRKGILPCAKHERCYFSKFADEYNT